MCLGDTMKQSDELQDMLENISRFYHSDEVPVVFDHPPHAKPDGTVAVDPNVRDFLGRNLEGPQELRVVLDTLSHEVEHIRETPLEAKKEIMQDYDECPQLAGNIYNVVEDAYIDHKRTRRLPGLRTTRAFVVDALMGNHHRRPRIDNMDSKPNAVLEGLLQMSIADYAKGLGECDDDVQTLVTWGRQRINEARNTDDADARRQISCDIIDRLIDTLGLDSMRRANDNADMPPGIEPDPAGAPSPPPIPDDSKSGGQPGDDGAQSGDDGAQSGDDTTQSGDDPTAAGGDGSGSDSSGDDGSGSDSSGDGGSGSGSGDGPLGDHAGHNVVLKR